MFLNLKKTKNTYSRTLFGARDVQSWNGRVPRVAQGDCAYPCSASLHVASAWFLHDCGNFLIYYIKYKSSKLWDALPTEITKYPCKFAT